TDPTYRRPSPVETPLASPSSPASLCLASTSSSRYPLASSSHLRTHTGNGLTQPSTCTSACRCFPKNTSTCSVALLLCPGRPGAVSHHEVESFKSG
ncbi:unnamed protein product, partial [Tetraodon nigroviridis]